MKIADKSKVLSVIAAGIIGGLLIFTIACSAFRWNVPVFNALYSEEVSTFSGANDLELSGDTYSATGGDPFLIAEGDWKKPFSRVNIEVSRINNENSPFQLFYIPKGMEISEENSVWTSLSTGNNEIAIPKNEYAALRLDFSEGDAVTLGKISVSEEISPVTGVNVITLIVIIALWFCIVTALADRYHGAVKIRLAGFQRYSNLLANLVKKDFTTKYRRSVLGILWSVISPLLMMLVISAVFSHIFRVQIENFAVYYLIGSLLFNFMGEATNGSLISVVGAGGLIKKVYIPKYIFPFEKCLFALVNAMFSLAAAVIIMPFLGVSLKWTNLLFWVPLGYTLVFSLGLGMILAAANVFFRDIGHLYGVWVMAWMYLTPILYPVEMLPRSVLWFVNLNPMLYYVSYFRQIMMYGHVPGLYTNALCAAIALLFLALGVFVFKKTQDRFILYI